MKSVHYYRNATKKGVEDGRASVGKWFRDNSQVLEYFGEAMELAAANGRSLIYGEDTVRRKPENAFGVGNTLNM